MPAKRPLIKSGDGRVELFDTDLAILKHVALYFLTFREALQAALFLNGGDPGNALAALARNGYLRNTDRAGNPLKLGSHRYYLMGAKGRDLLSLPNERATESPDAALHVRLATLWFCLMGPGRYYRLDKEELSGIFGKRPPHHNTPHCVGLHDSGPVIYRVYASAGEPRTIVRQARDYLDKALANRTLKPWVKSGDYGFAVLVETGAKCQRIQAALERKPKRGSAFTERARFVVSVGPTPETLSLALRNYSPPEEDGP